MKKRVELAFIVNKRARKAAQKQRKKGLMKKMEELTTLCGVEGCAIIYSRDEATPEVWPNEAKAESVVARFNMMSNVDRYRKMENQEVNFNKIITKLEGKFNKQSKDNLEKKNTLLMYGYIEGEVSYERKMEREESRNLNRAIDQKLEEISEEIRALMLK